jgi:hypothetical protein
MKVFLILVLSLTIFSCKRSGVEDNDDNLDALVNSSYDYYFKSTHNYHSTQNEFIISVIELKTLAEKAIGDRDNEKYFEDFERLAYDILAKYETAELIEEKYLLRNSLKSSIKTKVRLLEYIVVNTMIRYYHLPIYDLNYFNIIISTKNPQLRLNESFSSNIYLAFNSSYNRLAIVVNGDTIRSGPGPAITYNYPTTQREFLILMLKLLLPIGVKRNQCLLLLTMK